MKKRQAVVASIIVLLTLIIFLNVELISYGMGQAAGQIGILRESRPVEQVLTDPSVSDSIKARLRYIQKVRQFAFDSLHLKQSDNYTTFYDQKEKVSLWNLSACERFSFHAKEWWFPFLGSFPYKGFFELEKAKEERDALKLQGYDTRIRSVGGWSTLGWTTDPILSNMLKRSDGRLAELIIHELTHSTLFVQDQVEFNENLATYIGEQGARQFLEIHFGTDSAPLLNYLNEENDAAMFRNQMLLGTKMLNNLYESFTDTTPENEMERQKQALIDDIIMSLDSLDFQQERYRRIFEKARPNNAYFMSYKRYYSAEDSLSTMLEHNYNGKLADFVDGMKAYHEK